MPALLIGIFLIFYISCMMAHIKGQWDATIAIAIISAPTSILIFYPMEFAYDLLGKSHPIIYEIISALLLLLGGIVQYYILGIIVADLMSPKDDNEDI